MNKAKLFLVAAAPAALIMPIEAFAAAEQVTITGSGNIGSEMRADISKLPTETNFSYQWYYVLGNTVTAIEGATNSKFIVPAEAFGKTIMLKVTDKGTDSEIVYTSNAVVITPELKDDLLLTGDKLVNTKVTANINALDDKTGNPIVIAEKGYQWYYVDDTGKTAIPGATNPDLTLPIEAAGKELTVEVKTTNGLVYTSAPMKVKELSLTVTNPIFTETYVLPGAVVKAPEVTVEDDNGAELQPSQISYSYQWYFKEGNVYSIIDGATSASYTIPANAMLSEMKTIVMIVTAKVGAHQKSSKYSTEIEVSDKPIEHLKGEIDSLIDTASKVKYIISDFASFVSKVEDLRGKYDAFPSSEKSKVDNYAILQKALADVAVIKPFMEKMKAIGQATDKSAYAKGLLVDYEKFDYLQRSLVGDIKSILDEIEKDPNQGEILADIVKLNSDIIGIINGNQISYNMEWRSTNGERTLSEFRNEIESVQAYIKTLPRDYQSFVQNQNLLKTALADVKKVEVIEKKVQSIQSALSKNLELGFTKAEKSLIKQANTLLASYNKLTYLQQSLMSDEELLKILSKEEGKARDLADEVKNLQLTDDYTYTIVITTDKDLQDKLTEVTNILAAYKTFSKEAAKQITRIEAMNRLQKDLKAAQKVSKLIDTYDKLNNDSTKKASSYKSTKTAYDKLTTGQQSLVYNFSKLTAPKELEDGTEIKDPDNKEAAKGVISAIDSISTVELENFESYKDLVSNASTSYKGLISGARKYVTNYAQLQAAEKNVKGVEAFLKKVDAAKAEADKGKQYTKIQSVKTAYLKLPSEQQRLSESSYSDLLKLLDEGVYTNLDTELAGLYDENGYVKSIDQIKEYETRYNKLSSAERKQITNYYILKQALADVKKVDAFMNKYNSMSEKTEAAVLKDFKTLTAKQLSLVNEADRKNLIEKEQKQYDANEGALKLVDDINKLLVDGVYVAGVKAEIERLRSNYDALSTSQKTLVKNYSKLTQAESDLQKVEEVYALKGDLVAWQKAFNKLSRKLESLYNQIDTP